jgi:hypothetical protein
MSKIKYIYGEKFNRLTVIDIAGRRNSRVIWKSVCDCGNEVLCSSYDLRSGNTTSCGCAQIDAVRKMATTHGGAANHKSEYSSWCSIKTRCYNEKSSSYNDYGGRGIVMSDDWAGDFSKFYADMGDRPSKSHSIDRIDVNGIYCKENCRWATAKEQANNKRNTIMLKLGAERRTLSDISKEYAVLPKTLINKIKRGTPIENAIIPQQYKRAIRFIDLSAAQQLLDMGYSSSKVAKQLGCDRETIQNRIKNNLLTASKLA